MLKAIKKACMNGTALVTLATTCGPVFAKLEAANKRGVERAHMQRDKLRDYAKQHGMGEANINQLFAKAEPDFGTEPSYGLNLVRDEAHYMK